MVKCSIAMPSHRNYDESAAAVNSAYRFGGEIMISDNSGDDRKSGLPGVIKSPIDCPMLENFMNAFNGTTGDFVLLMQDDDRIFRLFDSSDIITAEPDVVGIQPTIQAFAPSHGVAVIYTLPLMQEMAQDRVIAYQESCKGSNLGLFTFWRRDVLASVMNLWCVQHPMKGAYNDWAVVRALVSSGKVIRDTGTIFFKDISNWTVDAAAETRKLYRDCGYEHMAQHNQLLNAIDGFIITARKDSPVAYDERIRAALTCLYPYTFDGVMRTLEENGLGEKYMEFYLYATGKRWGKF